MPLALDQLVSGSKLDRVLGNALFPVNNNPAFLELEDVLSATVVMPQEQGSADKSKLAVAEQKRQSQMPVGFGMVVRCAASQLYCPLVAVAKDFESGFVQLEPVKASVNEKEEGNGTGPAGKGRHALFKIAKRLPQLPDLSSLPQYFTIFADPPASPLLQCILDRLLEGAVGIMNVELRRNLTVDLYDAEAGMAEHGDPLWRDFGGLLVADRARHCELDIKCHSLVSALSSCSCALRSRPNLSFLPLDASTRPLFHHFDHSVAMMPREEFLDFLHQLGGIQGVIAVDELSQQPLGCALGLPGRVLHCYAEDEELASSLLCALVPRLGASSVSLFLRINSSLSIYDKLAPLADQVRRVRRLHSRAVPATVKWEKVFALNIGLHLF